MKKLIFFATGILCVWNICNAKVEVKNNTTVPIKVLVHYIGIGSPSEYILKPGQRKSETKDLANIKKRYQVWVKKGKIYELVVDEKVSDPGAFRKLDVIQAKEPTDGDVIYGIYSHGY